MNLSVLFTLSLFLCPVLSEICRLPGDFRTKSVSITDSSLASSDNSVLFSSVSGTIEPKESSISRIFRFVPAAYWIPLSSSESCNSQSLNMTPDATLRLAQDFFNLTDQQRNALPSFALWGDRSVLLFTISHLSLTGTGEVCPQMGIYPIVGQLTDELLSSLKHPRQISDIPVTAASCFTRDPPPLHFIYPLASAVWVSVHDLGNKPSDYDNKFQFVATAAYRLDPFEFSCPSGLFACDPVNDDITQQPEPAATQQWQIRLCLPLSLRCDGVINCPNGGSDEQNCEAPPSREFPPVVEEKDKLHDWLYGYSPEALQLIGRASFTLSTASINPILLISLCIISLIIVVFVVFGVVVSRRRKKRQQNLSKLNGSGPIHPYEPISRDSPEVSWNHMV